MVDNIHVEDIDGIFQIKEGVTTNCRVNDRLPSEAQDTPPANLC